MSQKQRFYTLASALGLDRTDAERRAVNRFIGVFDFQDITEDQFVELNNKLIENLNTKGIAIPESEVEKPKQRVAEDMSVDEIRNMFKPCEHEWREMEQVSNLTFCRECSICGAVALIDRPSFAGDIVCKHPLGKLVAKSEFKLVSYCPDCQFWLVEPIKSRAR